MLDSARGLYSRTFFVIHTNFSPKLCKTRIMTGNTVSTLSNSLCSSLQKIYCTNTTVFAFICCSILLLGLHQYQYLVDTSSISLVSVSWILKLIPVLTPVDHSKCSLLTLHWKQEMKQHHWHLKGLTDHISPYTEAACTATTACLPSHDCHTTTIKWLLMT